MRSDDQKNPASITYSNHRTYQIISLTKKSNRLIKIQSNAVSTIQIPKSQSPFFFSCEGNMLSCNQKVHSQSNIQNPPHTTSLFFSLGSIKMWPCDEKNHASSFKWCKPTYQNQSKSNILKGTTAFFKRKQ